VTLALVQVQPSESSDAIAIADSMDAVGAAYAGAAGERVLLFDPRTYELLGENEDAGGSADLESAIVGSSTARP
jgi:hypothetical protein